jgi:hypothetical protein
MQRYSFSLLLLIGCFTGEEKNPSDEDIPNDTASTNDGCTETALGVLPEQSEWIIVDGNSNDLFSLSDGGLGTEWEGSYGVYDLNSVEFEGANGFLLERPGTIVGAQVKWKNISTESNPVELYFWPDFGSDGYIWDTQNPYTIETRCLDSAQDGEWVEYVLAEPIYISQPLHVFAGYHRPGRETGAAAVSPEILQENYQAPGEPYYSGAWFFGVDDELYHLGMTSPWYTWQVRLAVVYDDEIPATDKPFQREDILSVSGRVAWGDFDNDGDDDVMTGGPALFRNNGDGTFTDVTNEAIYASVGSNGGVWGDYDNDGCLDYFGQSTQDLLLHNSCNIDGLGYTFTDVTVTSGINDVQTERDCDGDGLEEASPTEGSGWFDVDNDGWLDLYLANYECSSEHDYFQNYDDKLWRNNRDGTFSDWTDDANVPFSNQAGRGVTTADYDQDGDIDLFVSNYRLDPNFCFENKGDGTLWNVAGFNGTQGVNTAGAYGHTIGSVFGDIDNDLDFDLIQANLAHPFFYWFSDLSAVLVNDGTGTFTDEGTERGLYYRETHSNPSLFDADNDGDLDLFITSIYQSRDSDFYTNDGTGHFELQNYESGLVVRNGWGAATSDYDNDGDVDMLVYELYRNNSQSGNWLQVKTVGGISGGPDDSWQQWRGLSNYSAIGSIVQIETSDGSQLRQVSGGSGTGVQDSFIQHFGIGDSEVINTVTVRFTGGNTVVLDNVSANQRIWVHEDGSWDVGMDYPVNMLPPQLTQDSVQ